MKFIFLSGFFLAFCCVNAQTHYYELSPKIPKRYYYNADSVYKKLLQEKDKDLKEKLYKEYSESLAYYHERMLFSGLVYFNWTEIENYLNGLVKKIAVTAGIERSFYVYLLRNEDVNASAQDNGIIYVNIGLLAEMKDEAALVSVLAHEVSHAVNSDTRKNYLFYSRQRAKKQKIKDVLALSHENRSFESRADSVGFATAATLNYDLSSCYHTFIKFESEYRWFKSQYEYQDPKWLIALDNIKEDRDIKADSLEKYLSDHPENGRRLAALEKFIKNKNGATHFSGNEAFFAEIKYKARMEQLYIDFSESAYEQCLHNAFYYHLLDQQDKNYLYYISECLRRIVLIDPGIKRKGFLTDDSKEKIFENNKGILHDLSFVSLDTVFLNRMAQDPLYGRPEKPFENYLQACNHFNKLAQAQGVELMDLTAGLFEWNRNKKEKADACLKKYLEKENALHKEFIAALMAGTALTALAGNKNDLVYIESAEYYTVENGMLKYSYVESQKISGDIEQQVQRELKTTKGAALKFLPADSLDIVAFNTYWNLAENLKKFKPEKEAELERSAGDADRADYWASRAASDPLDPEVLKRNKNFFCLEPGYWSLFKKEQIHAFIYLKPYFYKHKILGTFFYLEVNYYDPVNRVYFYFDQEYAERYNGLNLTKVFNRFKEKLNTYYR